MKMSAIRILVLVFAAVAVSGCGISFLSDRRSNPVIEDYMGGPVSGQERLGFMATTASHRLVTMRLNTEGGVGESGMICPEPPPDVAQAITDAFVASLQASVEMPDGASGEGSALAAQAFATAVMPLLRRSQGVQFFRDGMYYLCIARINEMLSNKHFLILSAALRDQASDLIDSEIDQVEFYRNSVTEDEVSAEGTLGEFATVLEAAGDLLEGANSGGSPDDDDEEEEQ